MKIKIAGILIVLLCFTESCTLKTSAIKENYNFGMIKRIAVLEFKDSPSNPNSGDMVADVFAKYLIKAGYDVVERMDLEKIIEEHNLNLSGLINSEQIKEIGKISGVDAVITGTVPLFTSGKKEVVLVKIKEVITETRYQEEGSLPEDEKGTQSTEYKENNSNDKSGGEKVVVKKVIEREVPHTHTIAAEVGITCKMINIETGEVIWAASKTYEGVNPQIAAEYLVSSIVKKLSKALSRE